MLWILMIFGLMAPGDETEGLAVAGSTPTAPATAARAAESQEPTGRFLTATEVRPILDATRPNWVAVREYNGQDLIYFSHLLAWRCGLFEVHYAINGGAEQEWPLPECHLDTASPAAILPEDGLPYTAAALGSVERIDIRLVYDDLGEDSASFERNRILIP